MPRVVESVVAVGTRIQVASFSFQAILYCVQLQANTVCLYVSNCSYLAQISLVDDEKNTIGVVTASPEAATSHLKSHVACSGLVSLVVEGGNILHVRKLRRAQSSAPEVKNKFVERFVLSASPGFYLLSCFYLFFLFLVLLLSSFSCRLHGPRFCIRTPFLLRGNYILHIFILHAEVTKMGITPSSQN